MATHYIQKYDSTAQFAGESPEKPNAFPIGAIKDADGNYSLSSITTLTGSTFGSTGTLNQSLAKVTINPTTGSFTAANGLNAIRGEVNIASGVTMTSGFVAGVYGRCNAVGATITGTSLAAVYAKADYNGATINGGHVAPLMANIVNPPASSPNLNLVYLESAGGGVLNSVIQAFANANYALDFSEVGAGRFVTATAGAAASKYLRLLLNGTAYKIALLADS